MRAERDRGASAIEYGVVIAIVALAVGALAWGARAIISDGTSALDGVLPTASASPTPTGPPVVDAVSVAGGVVTVSGSNLGSNVTATIGGTAATVAPSADGRSLAVTIPPQPCRPGRASNATLVVRDGNGQQIYSAAIQVCPGR